MLGETTPKFAQMVAHKFSELSDRKVQADLQYNHARKVSRSYIQHISQAVEKVIDNKESQWHFALPNSVQEAKLISIGRE